MKIAVLSYYSGRLERGAENWADQLAAALGSKFEMTIFSSQARESLSHFTFRSLRQLADFDVVIPINGGIQALLTRWYCWFTHKKMVIVGHSGRGRDDRINLYCFPNVFVGLSQHACDWAKKVNPLVRVVHIPNGVDLDKFSPVGKKIKIDLPGPIVLAIGALEKNKQLDLTIQAVALTSCSLVILGGGQLEKELQRLGERLLPDRFKLAQVPFDQVPEYCRSATIFTLASWNRESYPLAYFEAMGCNLPIVATNDAVRQEIVGEAGILIDPVDIQAYARAIEEAVSRKWQNAPRSQAEKFSWTIIASEYEKMFMSL